MSQVKANSYLDASGGSNAQLYGVASPPNSMGFRNRIINGDMRVWQRATSATGTYSAGPSGYATTDRWVYYSGASMTTSQSTSVPSGFQYSLKVQRPNAATTTSAIYAFQVVESVNMLDLAGQSVALSFYAKSGANFSASGGVLAISVNTGTVADQGSASGLGGWTGVSSAISTSQAITTTWTRYTVTGTIASNALELDVVFSYTPTGTAGADDAFYITGVQLEAGTVASPFERRDYGRELMMCQRYYYRIFAANGSGTFTKYGIGFARGTTRYDILVNTPVSMRAAPTTLDTSATSSFLVFDGGADLTVSALAFDQQNLNTTSLNITVSGATQYRPGVLQANNNATSYIGLGAEL